MKVKLTVLFMAIGCGTVTSAYQLSPYEQVVFDKINEYRNDHAVDSVEFDIAMQKECYEHSRNMASGVYSHGHTGFKQRVKNIRAEANGKKVAENVACGYKTAEKVADGWLFSPGHRKNMLNDKYTKACLSVVKSPSGKLFYTQIFANERKQR